MREILFRGKREDCKRWVYGYYRKSEYNEKSFIRESAVLERVVIPETVGQYTGLTDKNDKKIFEGDIVKTRYANTNYKEHIEVVVFEGGAFKAMTKYGNGSVTEPLYDGTPHLATDKSVYMDSIEVIGNIHDNPELLESED